MNQITIHCRDKYEAQKLGSLIFVNETKETYIAEILNVIENVFTGTDGEDLIVGTRGRDAIFGLNDDDNLAGFGGRDRIYGGAGDDNISGGDGDDAINEQEADAMIKMLEILENLDDVQKVYSNADISEEIMEQL